MMLTVPTGPSLHNKRADLRASLKQAIVWQLAGRRLPLKLYKVAFVYYGNWFKDGGAPCKRDPNNNTETLFNVLAECLGFDDSYLNRDYSVKCVQSEVERVTVSLV